MTPISIVIPCFNLGRTVADSVDSALLQSRRPAQIVVVDDGSTEALTQQRLRTLHDPLVRLVRIDHSGAARARNHGAGLTTSPYLLFLDADDRLDTTYLEKAGALLDSDPQLDIVSSAIKAFEQADYVWTPPQPTLSSALTQGTIPITALFRREVWDAVGGFDETLPSAMDLDFWITAFERGFRACVIQEPLLHWRVRFDSLHHSSVAKNDYFQTLAMILRKHRPSIERLGPDLLLLKEILIAGQRGHKAVLESRQTALQQELATLRAKVNDVTPDCH